MYLIGIPIQFYDSTSKLRSLEQQAVFTLYFSRIILETTTSPTLILSSMQSGRAGEAFGLVIPNTINFES